MARSQVNERNRRIRRATRSDAEGAFWIFKEGPEVEEYLRRERIYLGLSSRRVRKVPGFGSKVTKYFWIGDVICNAPAELFE